MAGLEACVESGVARLKSSCTDRNNSDKPKRTKKTEIKLEQLVHTALDFNEKYSNVYNTNVNLAYQQSISELQRSTYKSNWISTVAVWRQYKT